MAVGPSPYCLVAGTTRGFIVAWDLRFQIPVQCWRHNAKSRILSLTSMDAPSVLPRNRTNQFQHPARGPLLFASAEGTNAISAFDLFTGECRLAFRVMTSSPSGSGSMMSLMRKSKKVATPKDLAVPGKPGAT